MLAVKCHRKNELELQSCKLYSQIQVIFGQELMGACRYFSASPIAELDESPEENFVLPYPSLYTKQPKMKLPLYVVIKKPR